MDPLREKYHLEFAQLFIMPKLFFNYSLRQIDFLTAKVAVQQSIRFTLFVCVSVSTFEIHLLKVYQANQSTV